VTTVEFWQPYPAAVIDPLVRRFEAENPGLNVHVVTLPAAGAADSLAAAVASGHPPDLCGAGSDDLAPLLTSGALSDWSAGVASLRDSLHGWPLVMLGDAIYGMPWQLHAPALFWNRALFARAGVRGGSAPATWEELSAAAVRIQKLGHGVHGFGLVRSGPDEPLASFLPFAWGNGAEILSAGGDSSRFGSTQTLAALEFLVKLRRASLVGGRDSLEREFAAGRLGMLLAETPLLHRLAARGAAADFGVALVPCPAGEDGVRASLARGTLLVSFTGSRRKEFGLRLARFLVRPENALAVAAGTTGGEAAWAGADSLPWYTHHPARQVLARQLATARFLPRHAAWDSMAVAIDEQVGLALGGRVSAARAVADADERLADLAGRKGR
jgi:ABC-type glycerol-3-phosphate transport system substrate-binding protein